MRPSLSVKEQESGTGIVRYDSTIVSEPGPALFDATTPALQAQAVSEGGRNAAWYVRCGAHEGVLRRYRRGGLVARVSSDRYFWSGIQHVRSLNEFDVLHSLYEAGLPVPRPYAAAYWRGGLTYRAAIIVERIPDVRPLASALDVAESEQVARSIFAMHEQGIWHADLNAYNILLDKEGRAWLIDFDKARRMVLSLERRSANLLRLRRSLVKVAGPRGLSWWDGLSRSYATMTRVLGM